jgi:YcxB-like protein
MVTARYTWDMETLRKGFAVHRKTQRAAKLIPLMALAFVAWGAYDSYTSEKWIVGLPLIAVGFLLLFGSRPLAMWQFGRSVRRSPSYGSAMTYTFDPEQIVNSGEGHHATFTWKKLYSATVTRDGILLYTNKNLFHWIPVSAFESPSDIHTVQSYLTQNGVRTQNV